MAQSKAYLSGIGRAADTRAERKKIARSASQFRLRSGVLYKVSWKRPLSAPSNENEVRSAIKAAHSESGHFGRDPKLAALQSSVWRPGCAKSAVAEYIKNCTACCQYNPSYT